ncbi:MAPEG family protein [Alteromonas sp. 5E99-2]|uniref:MAPEG family protein n=1 Tax=Alteromonas sp. 5E99-2 TaxID=2817683 RepID=UPI001A99C48D|nr:MAPEG family protein [Alteromonas sp. 5E99-2]MBO1255951.1 MAPEG family protein [Alteromonas sp. 5E99-2]
MILPVSAFYAGLFGLCYFYLSVLVIKERTKGGISLGDGNIDELNRAIRAHCNFIEYVPLCLLLLICLELNTTYSAFLHGTAITLLVGRLLHAYGLRKHVLPGWQRKCGMLLTFIALITLAVANLSLVYWKSL